LKDSGLPRKPRYDFERIKQEVTTLENYDIAWNSWFEEQGITPLRISYEHLSSDPAATLVLVCNALGVQLPGAHDMRPGIAKLSDKTNLDWMRRYRFEIGAT
jgi:LPS sulfotransferase NodH